MYKNEKGAALLTVLLMMMIFTILGLAILSISINGSKRTEIREDEVLTNTEALKGLKEGVAQIENFAGEYKDLATKFPPPTPNMSDEDWLQYALNQFDRKLNEFINNNNPAHKYKISNLSTTNEYNDKIKNSATRVLKVKSDSYSQIVYIQGTTTTDNTPDKPETGLKDGTFFDYVLAADGALAVQGQNASMNGPVVNGPIKGNPIDISENSEIKGEQTEDNKHLFPAEYVRTIMSEKLTNLGFQLYGQYPDTFIPNINANTVHGNNKLKIINSLQAIKGNPEEQEIFYFNNNTNPSGSKDISVEIDSNDWLIINGNIVINKQDNVKGNMLIVGNLRIEQGEIDTLQSVIYNIGGATIKPSGNITSKDDPTKLDLNLILFSNAHITFESSNTIYGYFFSDAPFAINMNSLQVIIGGLASNSTISVSENNLEIYHNKNIPNDLYLGLPDDFLTGGESGGGNNPDEGEPGEGESTTIQELKVITDRIEKNND